VSHSSSANCLVKNELRTHNGHSWVSRNVQQHHKDHILGPDACENTDKTSKYVFMESLQAEKSKKTDLLVWITVEWLQIKF
jgi:hypothetical protein